MERNGKATKEAEWVARLRELTTKTKESIFASGDVLIEMKSDLTKKRFKELIKQVPISIGHANNLMRVASRKFLRDPDIEPYLPPVIGTLIDLAAPKQWQDESIRRCIADGVMRPDVERNGLDEWIESQAVPADIDLIELTKTSIPRDNAEPSLLGFLNHDDWTQDEVNELIELLATTTSKKFGKQINFTPSRATARKLNLKEVRARKQLPYTSSPSLAEQEFEESVVEE